MERPFSLPNFSQSQYPDIIEMLFHTIKRQGETIKALNKQLLTPPEKVPEKTPEISNRSEKEKADHKR